MAQPITVNQIARNLSVAARHYASLQNVGSANLAFLPIRDIKNNYLYMKIGINLPINRGEWTQGIRQQFAHDFSSDAPFTLAVWEVDELADLYRHVSLDDDLEFIDLPNSDG